MADGAAPGGGDPACWLDGVCDRCGAMVEGDVGHVCRTPAAPSNRPATEQPLIERGRLVMDPARHKVSWAGKDVSLTVTEFLILEALAQRPGVVKSRNQLLDVAYSDDIYVDDRTIDSHIKRIRRKFRAVAPDFDAIETLYGVGYRFDEQ